MSEELTYQGRTKEFDMSLRIYLKPGTTKQDVPEARICTGELPFVWPNNFEFKNLREIDQASPMMKYVTHLTLEETFWNGASGYTFVPGVYEGNGFEVTISPSCLSSRGSDKNTFTDKRQDVFGRFDTINTAIAFWNALTNGDLLPTRPLCRELSLTESAYARQAAAGVSAVAQVSQLQATIDQLVNQIASLQQIVQDYVLTPQK